MSQQPWYYAQGQEQVGPAPVEQLQQLFQSGQLRADTLVWTEGMGSWLPAGSVPLISGTTAPPNTGLGYFPVSNEVQYAGFWLRFCAAFIDGICMAIPWCGFSGMLGAGMRAQQSAAHMQKVGPAVSLGINGAAIIISWLYSALMESSQYQATLGKLAVGIKVTDLAGGRISFARATGRHFGKFLSQFTLLIGYIMAGFTEKKQALHDLLASTLVTKKPTI